MCRSQNLVRGDPRVGSTPTAGNLTPLLPLGCLGGAQSIQSTGKLDIPELGEMARDLRRQAVQAFFFHNLHATKIDSLIGTGPLFICPR